MMSTVLFETCRGL